MYEGPIVAAYELKSDSDLNAADRIKSGPIAGIAVALPLSLAMWAVLFNVARLWF